MFYDKTIPKVIQNIELSQKKAAWKSKNAPRLSGTRNTELIRIRWISNPLRLPSAGFRIRSVVRVPLKRGAFLDFQDAFFFEKAQCFEWLLEVCPGQNIKKPIRFLMVDEKHCKKLMFFSVFGGHKKVQNNCKFTANVAFRRPRKELNFIKY